MAATLLGLPGPVPEVIVTYLNPASRKIFRLSCKDARQLVDRTVRSVTVDVTNVRVLCGPWRPLHTVFPNLRHLTVSLRSTGAVTWDIAHNLTRLSQQPLPLAGSAAASRAAARAGSAAIPAGPGAAAASYSFRLLRDCLPLLRRLASLDLTHCYLDPLVWSALCSEDLPRGLALRLHPAAALLFPGRSWADRLRTMLTQLAATRPDVRVSVVACGTGEGGGSISAGGAACWCDVDGEAGLRKVAEMRYICELAMCVWSRSACEAGWLGHLSPLSQLQRLHISCCNTTDPWDHSGLAGLSALTALRELSIGLTDSALQLADLAPLSACSALTALSVGWLLAPPTVRAVEPGPVVVAPPAAEPPLGVGVGGAGAAAPLAAAAAGGNGIFTVTGSGTGSGVVPLLSVRRFEVRCCLSAGPLPLADLVPRATRISLCALSVGGGGRVLTGHALPSLLLPPAVHTRPTSVPAASGLAAAAAWHGGQQHAVEVLPPPALVCLQAGLTAPAPASVPPGPLSLSLSGQLRGCLRTLELVQRDMAALAMGPGGEDTGRMPLPGVEQLAELRALEHLQLTGWRLRGAQLPGLLAAAQRLPRLRRLTLRDCDSQTFGWRASRAAQLGRCLGLQSLDRLVGLQLRALEHLQILGAPSLHLTEQLVMACRVPQLRSLELHGVGCWDAHAFQRILGTASCASFPIRPSSAGKCGLHRTATSMTSSCCSTAVNSDDTPHTGGGGAGGSRYWTDVGGGVVLSCATRVFAAFSAAATAVASITAASASGPSSGCRWGGGRASVARQVVVVGDSPAALPGNTSCTACGRPTVSVVLEEDGANTGSRTSRRPPSGSGAPCAAAAGGGVCSGTSTRRFLPAVDGHQRGCPASGWVGVGCCGAGRNGRNACSCGNSGIDRNSSGGHAACKSGCTMVRGDKPRPAVGPGSTSIAPAKWPHLELLVVHGCRGTSLGALRQHVVAAGLCQRVQVEWMDNTLSLGREPWVSGGGPESRTSCRTAGPSGREGWAD